MIGGSWKICKQCLRRFSNKEAKLLADELFEYCESDAISEEGIHQIIRHHKESTPNNNLYVSDYEFFHSACSSAKVTEGIIRCLLEYFPAAAATDDIIDGMMALHFACKSCNMSLGIIQLLIDAAPDSVRCADNKNYMLPLHKLCENTKLNEATAIEILKLLLKKYPDSVRHIAVGGLLPIHCAIIAPKSPEFCRVLIEAYPGSERVADDMGMLPFHYACLTNTVGTVAYLYELYPDSILRKTQGVYPIYAAIGALTKSADHPNPQAIVEVVKFLLSCDPRVKFQEVQGQSMLAYAISLEYEENIGAALEIIEAIHDAHPEFIRREDSQGCLPLHEHCTNISQDETSAIAILRLILEKHPQSIRHVDNDGDLPIHIAAKTKSPEFCRVLIEAYPGSERIPGNMSALPIHCACIQSSFDVVENLYNLYPDAINHATTNGVYPIHIAISTLRCKPENNEAVKIVKLLLDGDPNVKLQEVVQGQSLLHFACRCDYGQSNTIVALGIIEAIHDAHPELIRKLDNDGRLPLHLLCANISHDNTTTMAILRLLLEKHPQSIRHVDNKDNLPIHIAAMSKSPEFCRVLIEAYPGSERIATNDMEELPIHYACLHNTVATVEYLYNLYPDAIEQSASNGAYPIHLAIGRVLELENEADPGAIVDIVKFLLDCDTRVKFQNILVLACVADYADTNISAGLEIIEAIYDADPEAIESQTISSNPHSSHPQIQEFINSQLVYSRQANDSRLMTAPDENRQLPLHIALQNNVRLGSIKLLVKGNRLAVRYPDNSGALPMHVACMHHESVRVVQYLIELDTAMLEAVDHENNTPLHYACNGAKYETIAMLLGKYDAVSISKRNAEGKLPIEVLWESDEVVDRGSVEYTECLFRLMRAYPETVNCL